MLENACIMSLSILWTKHLQLSTVCFIFKGIQYLSNAAVSNMSQPSQ